MDQLPAGTRVDRYELLSLLGKGGMGVVYAAHDPELGRTVALKLVRDPEVSSRARLVREARTMALVSHPSVVTVYDAGTVGEDVFIAMEHLRGGTLRAWTRAGRRGWREVAEKFCAAGAGLAAAHAVGVVHRDFKPDNVLLGEGGRASVTDFGVARSSQAAPDGDPDVAEHAGTPAYMSPEQHLARAVDARSDQWSFCIAFWEALYGVRPFATVSVAGTPSIVAIAAAVTSGRLRPPPAGRAPRWLAAVLRRGLSVDPAARWPSMTALLAAIERAPRRRRLLLAAAGALLLAAGAVGLASRGAGSDCDRAAAGLDVAWGPSRAGELRRAFAATGRAHAADQAERVIRRLDAWASGWRAERTAVCVERLDPQRAACLDDLAGSLRARAALLTGTIEGKLLDNAIDAASLPPPSFCARAGGRSDLPADAGLRAAVLALRREQADVEALYQTGRFIDATARARVLLVRATALGHEPDVSRAHRVLGWAASAAASYAEAYPELRGAAEGFAALGDDTEAALAWLIVLDTMVSSRKTAGLDEALSAARGTVRRARQHDLEALLLITEGRAAALQGDFELGFSRCRGAIELLRREVDREHRFQYKAMTCAIGALQRLGRLTEALAMSEERLRFMERRYGPRHPRMAFAHHDRGVMAALTGDRGRAALDFQRAADIFLETQGPGAYVADELRHLAAVQRIQGDPVTARRTSDAALAMAAKAYPPGDREMALQYQARAEIAADAGDAAAAEASYEKALVIYRALDPPDPLFRLLAHAEHAWFLRRQGRCAAARAAAAESRKTLAAMTSPAPALATFPTAVEAECLRAEGQPARAAELLRAAAPLARQGSPVGSWPPHVDFLLARAEWDAGQDPPGALARARAARDAFAAQADTSDLEEMDAFLAGK